jgi:gliding motility-associated-like protein
MMTRGIKILVIVTLIYLPVGNAGAQPVWVQGTPAVTSTGPLTINLNYSIDRTGTVYIIVYNYNNTTILTSSYVRTRAILGPSGSIVETATLSVKKGDENKILQTILVVNDPNQIHTIYIVAADSRSILQTVPVRLTATTLPCPPANAGEGGNECDLNFVLNAVVQYGTGTWTRVSGPGTAIFSPNTHTPGATVTVSTYGTYTFRWTEINGACSSHADIVVNFYRQPTANAGSGGDACDLDFSLSAVTPDFGTGLWTMSNGSGTATFLPDAGANNATVIVSEYGTKVFTWTVTNGTCSRRSNVTVNFYEPPVANAGAGGNNCGREMYLKALPSNGTGVWTRVSGPGRVSFSPGPDIPDPKVTVSEYGTYVFRWTETNGICSTSATISVSFFEQISANAGNGGNECDRDFNLNAIPGNGVGTWSKVTGPGTVTFTPGASQYNARVTVSIPGEYDFAWTVVNNTCSSVDIIKVVFHSPPAVNAGSDIAICKGSSIQLAATGSGSFQWSPSSGLSNPAVSNPLATPENTILYTVTLTDQWGCRNSDQITIEVREQPSANAGPDQSLDYLFVSSMEATPLKLNETGEWSVIAGTGNFINKNSYSTLVENLSIENNSFLWSVSNGVCPTAFDTVNIIVHDLVIPNLITPNMDGKNDFFVVKGMPSLGKTDLRIFNRYGYIVFSDRDYLNNWNGIDNDGKPLPENTYFFILKPEKSKAITGYIVIRR